MRAGGAGVGGGKGERVELASCGSGLDLDLERLVVVVVGREALEFDLLVMVYLFGVMDVAHGLDLESLVCDLIARLPSERSKLFVLRVFISVQFLHGDRLVLRFV